MNRRKFVTVIALTGCSGCNSFRGLMNDNSDNDTREITQAITNGFDGSSLSVSVSVAQAVISPEKLPAITLKVTWNGDNMERFQFGNAIPFSQPQFSDEPRGVVLFPAERKVDRRNEKTWVPKQGEMGAPPSMITKEFRPGDSLSREWDLWADPEHANRIEPGEYLFRNTLGRKSGDEIQWSLRISIDEKSR